MKRRGWLDALFAATQPREVAIVRTEFVPSSDRKEAVWRFQPRTRYELSIGNNAWQGHLGSHGTFDSVDALAGCSIVVEFEVDEHGWPCRIRAAPGPRVGMLLPKAT